MTLIKMGTPTGVSLKDDSPITISGTTAEITILTYPVSGTSFSLYNEMNFNLFANVSTQTLLPGTLTFRIKYGSAALILGGGALSLLGGATGASIKINGLLANRESLSKQYLFAQLTMQNSAALSLSQPVTQTYGYMAMDSSQDQSFTITAQFSVASAANKLVVDYAKVSLAAPG